MRVFSSVQQYRWIGSDVCIKANPLRVNRLHGASLFQPVTILLNSINTEQLPNAYERNPNWAYRYICQYAIAAPTSQASLSATQFIGDTTVPSSAVTAATSVTVKRTEAPASFTSSSWEPQQSTLSPAWSTVHTSNSITTGTITVADDPVTSGLLAGLVVGGTVLLVAVVLLYCFVIRNGYYKKFKNVEDKNTTSKCNVRELKENPLYGR